MITVYSKNVHCDKKEDVIKLFKSEKCVVFNINQETDGGYNVDITY